MTVPFWPSDLPQRMLQEGYSEGSRDGRLFQAMEKGPPKVRRRTRLAIKPVQMTTIVDFDGKARLERFFEEETGGGSLPFFFPDQSADGFGISDDLGGALLTVDDEPLIIESWWLVMFAEEPPTYPPEGGLYFKPTFSLVILP